MLLFFDTETTGLPRNWKAPVSDTENWPRMVQLAWLLYDYEGNLIDQGNHIIRPDGYVIPAESSRIHGITTEKAIREGEDLWEVLEHFSELLQRVDYLVAHNMSFDEKILGVELIRMGMPTKLFFSKDKICTMESTTDFCAIPGNYGYKWPKLSELHYKVFGRNFDEAHDAAVDIQATARCFWELKRRNILYEEVGEPSTVAEPSIFTQPATPTRRPKSQFNKEVPETTEYAGFWLRLAAGIVDLVIANVLAAFIIFPLAGGVDDPKAAEGLGKSLGLILGWLYFSVMESSSSQATFGKQMVGIQVTDEKGNRIGFGKATGRFFGKFLSLLILYIGFLMIGFTEKKQGLHDIMAGALVVKNKRG